MSGTPLTKPIHNGSVQTGTGVSCMGSRRGSTGFMALRSSPWPFGFTVGVGAFFAVPDSMPWLLPHQSGPLARGSNQCISAALASIVRIVVDTCWLDAFVSFVGRYQLRELLDTRSTLESLAARGWRHFELLVGEAFRRQGYAAKEIRLGGANGGIELILRKDGCSTLTHCKLWKKRPASGCQRCVRDVWPACASQDGCNKDYLCWAQKRTEGDNVSSSKLN